MWGASAAVSKGSTHNKHRGGCGQAQQRRRAAEAAALGCRAVGGALVEAVAEPLHVRIAPAERTRTKPQTEISDFRDATQRIALLLSGDSPARRAWRKTSEQMRVIDAVQCRSNESPPFPRERT